MALTLNRYGRYSATQEVDFGVLSNGDIRANIFDASAYNVWIKTINILAGKQSSAGTTKVRLDIYAVDEGTNKPSTLLYSSSEITVTTVKDGASDGTKITATLATPYKMVSGTRYALAVHVTAGAITHSMRQAGSISATNEQFYTRTGVGTTSPNPFGTVTGAIEGHMTIWTEGNVNESPRTATGKSPVGAQTSTTPTFVADFRDRNGNWGTANDGEDTGDTVKAYRIQLRQVGTTTLKWNQQYNATGGEQTANQISKAYGGSALTRGVNYEWRIQFQDQFGSWGEYGVSDEGWDAFIVNNLGFVTLVSPTGRVTDDTPDFTARWTHQTSLQMKAVKIRLYDINNNLLVETSSITITPNIASAAAPGTLFTVTWTLADAAGLDALSWGTQYKYDMIGQDTGNGWSDWHSPASFMSFKTDTAPGIPTNVTPANGAVFTTGNFPKITAACTDADGDALTLTATITRPNLTTVDVTLVLSMVTGLYEFQTTATQLSANGTFKVKVKSFDGYFYSGQTTVAGSAAFSTENSFQYVAGPTITITSPADGGTVTSSSFTVSWTTTGQIQYQVQIYEAGSLDFLVYSTGFITSAVASHVVPSGHVINGRSYDVYVSMKNNVPLTGTDVNTINVAYTPPATLTNIQVNPKKVNSPWYNAIEILLDQSVDGRFQYYVIRRQALGGPDAALGMLLWKSSSDVSEVVFVDYEAASGYDYVYYVSQVVLEGLELLESTPVSGTAQTDLRGVVLSAVNDDGETYNVSLRYTAERDIDRERDEALFIPLDGSDPESTRSRGKRRTFDFDAQILTDGFSNFLTKAQALEDMDDSDKVLCYRDNYRRKAYVKFKAGSGGLKFKDKLVDRMTATLSLRTEGHTQGETVDG